MDSTEKFLEEIGQARANAATFYKVDLHIHSHESPDFPKFGDKNGCVEAPSELENCPSSQDYLDAAKAKGLHLIAITDHNLSRISAEVSALSIGNSADVVALPGMEVSVQATIFQDSIIHILVIFPEGHSSEDIQLLFTADTEMPRYNDRTRDAKARIEVAELIQRVHSNGGVCIAGHVNSNKGVRTFFRDTNIKLLKTRMLVKELSRRQQDGSLRPDELAELTRLQEECKTLEDNIQDTYLAFLADHEFDGVEVQKSNDSQFYSGVHTKILGVRPIACVLGSDAHNLQDIGLENSTTFFKMTKPGFADLARALKDPGTRIRYENTVNRPLFPRILGIRFLGGFFDGRTVGFSDNLTCFIGGRGTGKSAAIEALRRVFMLGVTHLPDDKQTDIEKRSEHTLSESSIELLYCDANGDLFILRHRFGEHNTTCLSTDGEIFETLDISVADNLSIKVYGWGEIEELARNKSEQLKLIDGFIPESDECRSQVETRMEMLKANTREIVRLAEEIENLLPKIADLPTKKAQLSQLATPELDTIFTNFDRNSESTNTIATLSNNISSLLKSLIVDKDQGQDNEVMRLEDILLEQLETAYTSLVDHNWRDKFQRDMTKHFAELENRYQSLVAQIDVITRAITARVDQLVQERRNIEAGLHVQSDDETTDVRALIERRKSLSNDVTGLIGIEQQIEEKQAKLDDLLVKRVDEVLAGLMASRRLLTDLREQKIAKINQRLEEFGATVKVSVNLRHLANRVNFSTRLGAPAVNAPDGVLKGLGQHYRINNYAGRYAEAHDPHSFVTAVLQDNVEALMIEQDEDGVKREIVNYGQAQEIIQHLHPKPNRTVPHYQPGKLKQLLELEHCDIEDMPLIMLDGTEIEELSPGQRCSTLIPIILLESRVPLIIDQPEDNLDNKLVFDLVVDILRSLKEDRQIIVATHNPNIPVSGDAEQVVVFETSSKQCCEQIYQGSIDEPEIVEQIKEIMEGSEDAFRIRAQKYGFKIE